MSGLAHLRSALPERKLQCKQRDPSIRITRAGAARRVGALDDDDLGTRSCLPRVTGRRHNRRGCAGLTRRGSADDNLADTRGAGDAHDGRTCAGRARAARCARRRRRLGGVQLHCGQDLDQHDVSPQFAQFCRAVQLVGSRAASTRQVVLLAPTPHPINPTLTRRFLY
jgi:hypothetical protein